MPVPSSFLVGAPCWADLWTSDVEVSRRFYTELFGWEALEPNEEFGGYFMFQRHGSPIAGGMGDMGTLKANDTWKIYLSTDNINQAIAAVQEQGGEVVGPPMPVADLGWNAVFNDPSGAHLGAWQSGVFPGFTALNEPGAPCWFELLTTDYPRTLDFYRSVFAWQTEVLSDTDDFRYSTLSASPGGPQLAGIMDGATHHGEVVGAHWSIYWQVEDADAACATAVTLGGTTIDSAKDTPYGRMATLADPCGATFRVCTPPA